MEYKRCIRYKKEKYTFFDDINKYEVAYIYIPAETIAEPLKSILSVLPTCPIFTDKTIFEAVNPELIAIAKQYYNPLLKEQHILLLSDKNEVLYELPFLFAYLYADHESTQMINDLYNGVLGIHGKETLSDLFLYILTKNIIFLNKLTSFDLDLRLFSLAENYLSSPRDSTLAAEITDVINNIISYPQSAIKAKLSEINDKNRIVINKLSDGKNLVLIHLESISNLIYYYNKRLLPELSKLMDESLNFTKFYSSATSTIMSVCAIFHGNDFEADRFKEYNDFNIGDPHNENLFKTLNRSGYRTRAIAAYDKALVHTMRDTGIWDDGETEYEPHYSHADFIHRLETYIDNTKNEKFALFVDNKYTHCGIGNELIQTALTFEEKMELSFISLNETIKAVYNCLKGNNLLDKTIIVAYGDHGDDKWTRSLNYGFSHSTEPYGSIINTPLLVFDRNIKAGISDRLISATDVKYMLLYLLNIRNTDKFPFCGRNAFLYENSVVYSQSHFSNQREYEVIKNLYSFKLNEFSEKEHKNKSFAAVNNHYCLVASNKGMELFNIVSDPLCYNNLLRFYELSEDAQALRFKNYNAWRGHFRHEIMKDSQIFHCLSNFYVLREQLIERVKRKNEYVKSTDKDLFDFKNFNKINGGIVL